MPEADNATLRCNCDELNNTDERAMTDEHRTLEELDGENWGNRGLRPPPSWQDVYVCAEPRFMRSVKAICGC